jgi:hypothetical protein
MKWTGLTGFRGLVWGKTRAHDAAILNPENPVNPV